MNPSVSAKWSQTPKFWSNMEKCGKLSSVPPHQNPNHVLSGTPLGWVFNDRALTFLTRAWVRGLIRLCVLWIGLIPFILSANSSDPGSRHASYQPYRTTLSNTDRLQLCCWLTPAGGCEGGLWEVGAHRVKGWGGAGGLLTPSLTEIRGTDKMDKILEHDWRSWGEHTAINNTKYFLW